MVLVVGNVPSEIRISREQYLNLLSRLETAVHGTCPHEAELAYEVLDIVRTFVNRNPGPVRPQVDGQLELPLEWDADAGR